jgi:L-cysteine S-thiosulfotransferase
MIRAALLALCAAPAAATPLTDTPGDPDRGRAIVADRQVGLCLLCHSGPFPEVPFMGTLAPDLSGVGARLIEPEIRDRLIDSRALNPDTIMPAYFSTDGLTRVAEGWQGRTILTAQQIEDVTAYLTTLKETP